MFFIDTSGTPVTVEDRRFTITRTWEKMRETEKAILLREHMVLTRIRDGKVTDDTIVEEWLPKSAIIAEIGSFIAVKDFAFTGKNLHPLKGVTYEYGEVSPELAGRILAAIERGEGQWK